MQQRTRKILYETHAWAGLLLGVFLFVICFSGSVATFIGELAAWETPHLRRRWNPAPFSLEARYQDARAAGLTEANVFITLPNPAQPTLMFASFSDGRAHEVRLDPHSGAVLAAEHGHLSEFLGHLHTDLHLPYPLGRFSIGLAGVFLLLLLLTGFLIHRKRFTELWLTRTPKTRRMWLTHIHKLIGTWGLPFTVTLAFTGAILGLLGFLGPFMALATFNGDVDAATAAFSGPPAQRREQPAAMLSLDRLRDQVHAAAPDMQVQYVSLREYGDAGAQIEFNGPIANTVTYQNSFVFSGVDGRELHRVDWLSGGIGRRLFGLVTPLHFAGFGGAAVKWLYFLLGLCATALCATGTMIWVEKRATQKRNTSATHHRYARFAMGCCGGLISATLVLFPVHLIAGGQVPFLVFWMTWLGITLVAMWGSAPRLLARRLCWLNGLLACAAPCLNGFMTGHFPWVSYRQGFYSVLAVDLTLFATALLFLASAPRLKESHTNPETATATTNTGVAAPLSPSAET